MTGDVLSFLALPFAACVLFVLIHVFQVLITGGGNRMRSMITGRYAIRPERTP